MIAALQEIYADSIGTEFQHIQNPRIRNWVRDRVEARPTKHHASTEVEIALLRLLLESEAFEVFLHTRYVGQKRFSLQGAESLMVILDTILHRCPGDGIEEICMGMAHRGRLNILANFLQKSLKLLFTEFSTNYIPELVAGDGDVKYHLGYHTIRQLSSGAEVEIRRVTSKRSTRSWKESRARGSGFVVTRNFAGKSCRCSCTATRLLPVRASFPKC